MPAGGNNNQWGKFSDAKTIWIGIVAGVGMAVITGATLIPYARHTVHAKQAKLEQ